MKTYQVGGSVRDSLLGLEVRDRDYVVVGASADALLSKGFRQVGADFPVFLHPETNDEYALARLERKTGAGYHGFEVSVENVTLEEDLSRRDLTVNAMAVAEDGSVVDPYNGRADLAARVLRHVSAAFKEDPVRVLRIFRFLARFGPTWRIADETQTLIREMVAGGETAHLVAERVWKETERALSEPYPSLYVEGLHSFGLLQQPGFEAFRSGSANRSVALDRAVAASACVEARFAVAFGSTQTPLEAPGIPQHFLLAARLAAELAERPEWIRVLPSAGESLLEFLTRAQAFKQQSLLAAVLQAGDALGLQQERLKAAVARARAVDTRAISTAMPPGPAVGVAVRRARIQAMVEIRDLP